MQPNPWSRPTQSQLFAASEFTESIRAALRTPKGISNEKSILIAAQLAGSFLLRSLDIPMDGLAPGDPVFSDRANAEGPMLVQTLGIALSVLQIRIEPQRLRGPREPSEAARIGVNESQTLVERALTASARKLGLTLDESAHACALAAAQMIQMSAAELDPYAAFELATWGFVQGSKTVPIAIG